MNKFVLISPHADDIALSIGGLLIHNLRKRLFKAEICTIYSVSNHAPYANKENIKNITDIRRNEDKKYAKAIKCKIEDFGFKEALLRGYDSISSLYVDSNVSVEQSFKDVEKAIVKHRQKVKPALMFFPCGIGDHIEHRVVSSIGSHFINSVFYEDLPYAADYNQNDIIKKMRKKGMIKFRICFGNLKERLDYLKKFYPSQISENELSKVRSYFSGKHPENLVKNIDETPINSIFYETFWCNNYSARLLEEVLTK